MFNFNVFSHGRFSAVLVLENKRVYSSVKLGKC